MQLTRGLRSGNPTLTQPIPILLSPPTTPITITITITITTIITQPIHINPIISLIELVLAREKVSAKKEEKLLV